jgi:sec-independent protein translocase protein TatA
MSICGLGPPELIVIGIVLLIILSASRMGAIGNALGKFVYSFKKASRGQETIDVTPRRVTGETKKGQVIEGEVKKS